MEVLWLPKHKGTHVTLKINHVEHFGRIPIQNSIELKKSFGLWATRCSKTISNAAREGFPIGCAGWPNMLLDFIEIAKIQVQVSV